MPEFFQTAMGRTFYDHTLPTIARELARLPEDEEVEALQRAIDCLTTAVIHREAEINRAVQLIREIGGWPDRDIRDVWMFLRDKMRIGEDEKLKIESRLGIR